MASREWDVINTYPAESLKMPSMFLTATMPEEYWRGIKHMSNNSSSYISSTDSASNICWFYANYYMLNNSDFFQLSSNNLTLVSREKMNMEHLPTGRFYYYTDVIPRASRISSINVPTVAEGERRPALVVSLAPKVVYNAQLYAPVRTLAAYILENQESVSDTSWLVTETVSAIGDWALENFSSIIFHTRGSFVTGLLDPLNTIADENGMVMRHHMFTCLIPQTWEHIFVFSRAVKEAPVLNPNRVLIRRTLEVELFAPPAS